MAEAKELARIRHFVRKNKHRYLEPGLRRKLLDAGHDPAAVEIVLAEIAAPQAPSTRAGYFLGVVLVTILVNFVLVWKACDLMVWLLFFQIFIIAQFAILGNWDLRDDEGWTNMRRILGGGCGVGFLLSLPITAYLLSHLSCGF